MRLFGAVTQDPNHVLCKLLPEAKRVIYNLRSRVHGFQLPTKQETLFLASYTKTYTNCFDSLVTMFSPCIVRRVDIIDLHVIFM